VDRRRSLRRPRETTAARADFLVELRGFEPLTSAVQAPAGLTGSSLPFLRGSSATSATTRAWPQPKACSSAHRM
jgi:hypothetical protein